MNCRDDDPQVSLAQGHAERTGGFELGDRHRLKSAAERFRQITGIVERQCTKHDEERAEMNAVGAEAKSKKEQLQQGRGIACDFNPRGRKPCDRANPRHSDQSEHEPEKNTEKHGQDGDFQGRNTGL